ncbi:uncharacterized protein DUF1849 [Dongia mobilis]|uniref:Uncharacterized protein DUF1849 n=1 Tax=Dongia mobilis TaxID=578943 RepID=A0A4R6WLK6_9PROT|nr:DUF1849 family protein [Dongia mobilis]TDQ81446.1 uncharacterized protein DUF1849 [Dongia mobilis]
MVFGHFLAFISASFPGRARPFACFTWILALLIIPVSASGVCAADLIPHRAGYVLRLAAGSDTSGGGTMTYEIKSVCDGWAVEMKADLTLLGADGRVQRLGWNQITWEARDGSRYRYFMRESSDGEETGRRRGEARRQSPQSEATVTADLPQREEFTLPGGILFPVQHTEALIAAEASGQTFLSAQLFDGAVENDVVELGASLGKGVSDWKGAGKATAALSGVRSFPVGLAYFFSESPEGLPDSEQHLRLYVNGVVGELIFSLGSLEVEARLEEFRQLEPEGC